MAKRKPQYEPVEYRIVHADGVDTLMAVDASHAFTEAWHEFDGTVSVQRLPNGRVFTIAWHDAMVARRKQWGGLWQAALANMPYRRGTDKHGHQRGKQAALALCLGIPTHTKTAKRNYVAHTTTYRAMWYGQVPHEPVRSRLLKFAGPHGRLLAHLKLTALGLAHKFEAMS